MEACSTHRPSKQTPEERWDKLWKILFGDTSTPEPPVMTPEDLSIYSDFLRFLEEFEQHRLSQTADGPDTTAVCCLQMLTDLRNHIVNLREQERANKTLESDVTLRQPVQKEQPQQLTSYWESQGVGAAGAANVSYTDDSLQLGTPMHEVRGFQSPVGQMEEGIPIDPVLMTDSKSDDSNEDFFPSLSVSDSPGSET